MDKPFFSIITCTYNSKSFLQKNIDSVRRQTFKNYEHIFIDGNSNDGTLTTIEKYKKESSPGKIKLFLYPPKGVSNAFNKGILKSNGHWLVFLNSDDEFYDSNVLSEVFDFIQAHEDSVLIYGKSDFLNFLGDGKVYHRVIPDRSIYRKLRFWLLAITNYVPHQSVFMKKSVFTKYGGFDEELHSAMDYDLWLRLARAKVKNSFLDDILSKCRIRKDSVSIVSKMTENHTDILRKYIKSNILVSILQYVHTLDSKRSFF